MPNKCASDLQGRVLLHKEHELVTAALEGMINGKEVSGRRIYQIIHNIMINGMYEDTKRKAEKDGTCKMDRQNKKCSCAKKSGRRKKNSGTDKEAEKEIGWTTG